MCHRGDIGLAAVSRVDCHQQDHVEIVQKPGQLTYGCVGTQGKGRLFPDAVDIGEGTLRMPDRLNVQADQVRAGFRSRIDITVAVLDHEMDVKGLFCQRTDAFHDRKTE